jgi:hypothetical protein
VQTNFELKLMWSELLWTSDISNKTISRPPKSCETIS